MSVAAIAYVKTLYTAPNGEKLRAIDKAILYTLADYYNDQDGAAWPSIERLAVESGIGRTATKSHLNQLTQFGVLEVERQTRKDGSNTANRYRFPGLERGREATEGGRPNDRGRGRPGDRQEPLYRTVNGTVKKEEKSELRSDYFSNPLNTPTSAPSLKASWLEFLNDLAGRTEEGILSPVRFDLEKYARKCAQSRNPPPDVDLMLLFEVARAVKKAAGRDKVVLTSIQNIAEDSRGWSRWRQCAGVSWLDMLEQIPPAIAATAYFFPKEGMSGLYSYGEWVKWAGNWLDRRIPDWREVEFT